MMKNQNKLQSLIFLLTLMFLMIISGAGLTKADESVAKEKPRMLMLTQSKGYRHSPVNRKDKLMAPSEKAMLALAERSGLFEVDFSQDAATHITKENLQKYQLVVFYTSGKLPIADDDLKYLLNEWMHKKGNGFIGFHSATDTLKENQSYWDFIGGSFNGHPWNQNTVVNFKIHEPDHPAMKPFGGVLELKEEIYQYKNWQPEKVRVLMSIDMTNTDLKRPYHVPVTWVKQVGEGKMFYTNLGHREDTWENEQFLESIESAVKWLQGTEEGAAAPNPDVSKAFHQESLKASEAAGVTVESVQAEERAKAERKRAAAERKKKNAAKKKAGAAKKADAKKMSGSKKEPAGAGK